MSKTIKADVGLPNAYGEAYCVFPRHVGRIEGKMLTLIETLGLTQGQEKATKDFVQDIIQGIYREAEHMPSEITSLAMKEKYERINNGVLMSGSTPSYTPAFD